MTAKECLRRLTEAAGVKPVLVRSTGPHRVYELAGRRLSFPHSRSPLSRGKVERIFADAGLPSPWHR